MPIKINAEKDIEEPPVASMGNDLRKIIDRKSVLICDCSIMDGPEWRDCSCYARTTQGSKIAGPLLFYRIRGYRYRHGGPYGDGKEKTPELFEIIPEEDRKMMESIHVPQDKVSETIAATRIPKYMEERLDVIIQETGKSQSEIVREAVLLRIYKDIKDKKKKMAGGNNAD